MSQNERITQAEWDHLRKIVPESHELPVRRLTRHERTIEALIVASAFLGIAAVAALLWIWLGVGR